MSQTTTRGIRKDLSSVKGYFHESPEALAAPDPWSECLTVLEISSLPDSVHFRAYAERVGDSPMLRWVVQRLRRAAADRSDLVIVADRSEASRVQRALEDHSGVSLQLSSKSGQLHDLQELMRGSNKTRLLLVNITAALLPPELFRGFLHHHLVEGNHATTLAGHPCSAPPVLVEADLLLAFARGIPGLPKDVLPKDLRPAIEVLARAVHLSGDTNQVRVGTILALTAEEQTLRRWPYRVWLHDPDDVAILHEVLHRDGGGGEDPDKVPEPLDKWTEVSSKHREGRLAALHRRPGARTDYGRNPRRVLQVQAPSAFSGGEEVVVLLAERIIQGPAAFDCTALVGLPGVFTERLTRAGADVRVAYRDFARSSVENYLYSRCELDAVKPGIVHAHSITGTPFCCAAAERRIPFLQHVHVASEEDLTNLSDQIAFASAVIAVSEFVKGQLIRLGTDPKKIHVIHNGVMTAPFRARDSQARSRTRQAIGVPQDARLVLVAARLAPNKRHDIALESFAILRSHIPNAYLVLAGEATPGDEAVLEGVEARIARLRLRDSVRLLGFWRDMPSLYAAADVVLLPSEGEPLGLAILEAMAAGVPVVGACSGGIPEMIIPGVSGLLAEPGHVDAFAGAMRQVLVEDELRTRLVERGLTRVEREFSVSRFVDQVRHLYQETLASASVAGSAR